MRAALIIIVFTLTTLALAIPAVAGEAKLEGPAPFFFVSAYNPKSCGSKLIFLDRLVGKKALEAKTSKKVLLITFFNIDCKPCRKEQPFLQQKIWEP